MRVRADAGAASFRRQASLQQHLAEAGELVKGIKAPTGDFRDWNAIESWATGIAQALQPMS